MIIPKHPTEPFAASDIAFRIGGFVDRFDQLIVETLMVSLRVIVGEIFADRVSQLLLIEKDHPIQALGFNTSHKPFDIRVELWGSRRQDQRFRAGVFERRPKRFGEF